MNKNTMNVFLVVILLLATAGNPFVFAAAEGGLNWETDWNTTLTDAAKAQRPVLIDFYTDWCPPCKKLAADTFTDSKMIDYFTKEKYLLIKVNPEKDRVAEEKFKVYSYPTLLIFNAQGAEIDRVLGFRTAEELIALLEDLKKGIGTLEDLLKRLEESKEQKTPDTFTLMSKIIDKYIAKAEYPKALEMVSRIVAADKDNAQKQAASALYQKGYIYYKWKKFKEAIDNLVAIHTIYPDSEEAEGGYAAAAFYSEKLNDPALTLKILKDFVKLFPNSKYADGCRKKIEELEKSQAK